MKVLLADPNALMREGLKAVLADLDEAVEIIEAESTEETLERLDEAIDVDLALVDLALPGMEGCAGVGAIRERAPDLPVVVLAEDGERASAVRAFDAGAAGFLPKSLPVAILLGALRLIRAGGTYAPPELLTAPAPAGRPAPGTARAPISNAELAALLTARQLDVLAGLAQGRSNREIAGALGLSESTVKVHVNRILKSLQVKNRSQAALTANGLAVGGA